MTGPSDFVATAEAFVAATSAGGAIFGGTYAASEAGEAIEISMAAGGEIALIGTVQAVSDIGALSVVGATTGAAAGIVALPALGAGYAVGSLISPWVNRNLIDPLYGY